MLTMEEAMKQSAMRFVAGEIVKGTIIEVRPKEVLVDIGYKSEGVITANEFEDIKIVKVGDQIDVLIEKLEDKDGVAKDREPLQSLARANPYEDDRGRILRDACAGQSAAHTGLLLRGD